MRCEFMMIFWGLIQIIPDVFAIILAVKCTKTKRIQKHHFICNICLFVFFVVVVVLGLFVKIMFSFKVIQYSMIFNFIVVMLICNV